MLVWSEETCYDITPMGGHLYFRLDIILVKGHSKHILNMYFSGMKIDRKYVFLQVFFLICLSCLFQNLSRWPKTHPFLKFCTFCTPKQCMCVHCLVLKNNPNYVNFFYEDDIQLHIQVYSQSRIKFTIYRYNVVDISLQVFYNKMASVLRLLLFTFDHFGIESRIG